MVNTRTLLLSTAAAGLGFLAGFIPRGPGIRFEPASPRSQSAANSPDDDIVRAAFSTLQEKNILRMFAELNSVAEE